MSLRLKIAIRVTDRMLGPAQRARGSQFILLPPTPGSVVFLGDSITEGGLWHEWFPGEVVVNRGVSGETASQVLHRIDAAVNSPAAVFLLIGTNDLNLGYSREAIAESVEKILARVTSLAPAAKIYVQSVMPRGPKWKRRIQELNESLSVAATQAGARYIDLWPALAEPDGALRSDFTIDGLHLTGRGYEAWVNVLRPFVVSNSSEEPTSP